MSSFQILLVLSVTLSVSWISANAAKECSAENDEWACKSGACIAKENLCDGIQHCRDGSDEKKESCKNMLCTFDSFRCRYGACISLQLICDGVPDCVDLSDEDNEMCRARRDDLPDDGIDEETKRKNCAGWGQMKCWSGQCVNITDKCNGVQNCDDGSDELPSLCKTMLCRKKQFQCGYGACIPTKAKCNGTKECWDGTDEQEELCTKEIDFSLTPTEAMKSTTVTESIVNPTIKATKANKLTEHSSTTKRIYNNVLDYAIPLEGIENSEKDILTAFGVKTTNIETTTNRPPFATTVYGYVETENKEIKTTETLQKPLNGVPSEQPNLVTTSVNETISTQKKSVRTPMSTTSAANLGMDLNELPSKNFVGPTTKENVTKRYSERGLQTTTPKIYNIPKFSHTITNQTFSIDLRNNIPLKQPNSNGTKGQEVKRIQSQLDVSQNTLSTPNVVTQTPVAKTNISLIINNSFESNSSVQIRTNSPQQTGVFGTTTLYYIRKTSNGTEKQNKVNYFGNVTTITELKMDKSKIGESVRPLTIGTITPDTKILPTKYPQTHATQYNVRKTTTPTTTTKAVKFCILRSCGHPLFCQISLPGTHDSGSTHDNQGRLSLKEGSQVVFNCANGYILEGVNRTTCKPNGWSHNSPSCNLYCDADFIHNCTSPLKCFFEEPNIKSEIFVTKNFAKSKVKEHSQFSFACDESYLIEGPKIRKCTAKGWSNEMPRCVNHCDISDLGICKSPLKCKVFDSNTGASYDYQYSRWNRKIKEGSFFEYSCAYGYKINGANRSTCMNNGWNSETPTCIPWCDLNLIIPCKAPLICNTSQKRTRSFLNVRNRADVVIPDLDVYFSCQFGYELDGEKVITCTNTGWNNSIPTCKKTTCNSSLLDVCTSPLNCEIYDFVAQSYRRIYKGNVQQLSQLEYVHTSCEDGYILQGTQSLTCRGGKWDGTMPKCVEETTCDVGLLDDCTWPLKCEIYDFVAQSYRRIYKGNVQQLSQWEYLRTSCEDGYILQGTQSLTCRGGKWDDNMPKCLAQACMADLLPKCENPLICTAFDENSKSRQQIINNYRGSLENYSQGTVVVFDCADRYELHGAKTAICDFHGWKYEDGIYHSECQKISNTCDKAILDNCTYPLICKRFDPEFNDFRRIYSATDQKLVSDAEHIKFSCENDYVLDGRNLLTCTAGKWDHNMPKCIARSCRGDLIPDCKHPLTCTLYDSKSKSEQIITKNNIIESTNYALNTQVVFSCANGYNLKGEEQSICSSNGWSHAQSLKLPQCISPCDPDIFKICKEPLNCFYLQPNQNQYLKVHSDYLITEVGESSFLAFRCNNDFKLQGTDSIKCNSKGWDEPLPKCV